MRFRRSHAVGSVADDGDMAGCPFYRELLPLGTEKDAGRRRQEALSELIP